MSFVSLPNIVEYYAIDRHNALEHRYVTIQLGGTSFDRDVIEEGTVLKQE